MGSTTTSSLMVARIDLRPIIPNAMGVMSGPVDVLIVYDVHDRLKLGLTLVRLLT